MSVSAWFDVTLFAAGAGGLAPKEIFNSLLGAGWTFDDNGKSSYLPLGDVDEFDWRSESASDKQILDHIGAKALAGEVIGVVMTWKASGVGGQFLLEADRLSVSLSVNRVRLTEDESLTDVSWYLPKLIPCLNAGATRVASFSYEEYP